MFVTHAVPLNPNFEFYSIPKVEPAATIGLACSRIIHFVFNFHVFRFQKDQLPS
jgi:hypothetical protein